ncbi:pyridoxamine 5'-phosphate oxidase family protein [Streptomyces cylindrosporus]|uniref:Pyridoxamine 5'-phosphate oxidase family protein n=1 Tax=Streptomyces cylindrosporus TaxID=2927583 RepID=A0ABS9YLU3_9ACTN|nr:pyridoxamine 5'-phosphate oxidase family protein [Streptomyces cylindrosporus]MCI3278154.1 pyridoxamine 5'-phosphate oxidase family protein [Streptomyces cylindrosporus]
MAEQAPSRAAQGQALGDLGRRIAARRVELGLSRHETADRAGMAPGYLKYLEERPGAAPGSGVLLRLAEVLETTVRDLTGGDAGLPPGPGRPAPGARLVELSVPECRALLADHGVGRIAVPTASGPVVVPVNYSVVDGAIVFRTEPGSTPAQASGCQVAFEADRIDDAFSTGWSVLVRGHARTVTDPGEAARFDGLARGAPWAGGHREEWVRIDPVAITGRRITA